MFNLKAVCAYEGPVLKTKPISITKEKLVKGFWEWLGVDPFELHGAFIAGGAIRDFWNLENSPQDIDIFYSDCNNGNDIMNELPMEFENKGTSVLGHTEFFYEGLDPKLQFIHCPQGESVEKLFDDFDFTMCMFAFDGKTFYSTASSVIDSGDKVLRIHNNKTPFTTLRRMSKFTSRGYVADTQCHISIAEGFRDISEENWESEVNKYIDEEHYGAFEYE